MAYIGKTPTPVPLTSSDIATDIINNTHIGDTAISGFDALATEPADTDEFLISDGGVLKRIDASLVGGGKIAQVVQAVKTDTASTSSSFADTGLSASITPSSSSSKVLVLCTLGGVSGANTSFKGKLVRGSTDIFVGDSASNRPQASAGGQTSNNYEIQQLVMNFLDSPSTTSSTTYKAQFGSNGSITIYLNRTSRDNDGSAEDARSASSIILMEVLA